MLYCYRVYKKNTDLWFSNCLFDLKLKIRVNILTVQGGIKHTEKLPPFSTATQPFRVPISDRYANNRHPAAGHYQ